MYVIQFWGTWGGQVATDWRPAVTGTLNQTGRSDLDASTFETWGAAVAVLDDIIRPAAGDAERKSIVQFRIVEA